MAMLGPPGHGKTYLTRNLAKSLVGEQNVLEADRIRHVYTCSNVPFYFSL